MSKLSITQKIAFSASLIAVIVAFIVGFNAISSSKNVIETRMLSSSLPSQVNEIRNAISTEINTLLMAAEQLAENEFILAWTEAQQGQPQNEAVLTRELQRIVRQYDLKAASWANRETNNYWNQDGFLRTLNTQQDAWYFAFTQSGRSNLISIYQEAPNDVRMYVNHQQVGGVALAGLGKEVNDMVNLLNRFTIEQTGFVYIVDASGLVQLHKNSSFVAKKNIDTIYETRVSSSILNPNGFSYIETQINDSDVIVAASPVANTELYVVAQVPKSEVFSSIDAISTKVFWISLFAAVVATLLAFILARSISRPLEQIATLFTSLGHGEARLDYRLPDSQQPEINTLSEGFNAFMTKIEQAMDRVSEESRDIAVIANQVLGDVRQNAAHLDQQKDKTVSVAAAINQMGATVQEIASSAANAAHYTQDSKANTDHTQAQVSQSQQEIQTLADDIEHVSGQIDTLSVKTAEIGSILDVIRSISEQTNLLALNAAIESARAGEHGRGFAVVADEVRGLAQRTSQSTDEIQRMIEALTSTSSDVVANISRSKARANEAVDSMSQTSEKLSDIVGKVNQINDMATVIATATEEQSAVVADVGGAIEDISAISDTSAQSGNEVRQAIEKLTDSVNALDDLVASFKP